MFASPHNDIKIKDVSEDSLSEFLNKLGVDLYIETILGDIQVDGYWEAFNDGNNSVTYSSVTFLNYRGEVFASEVYDDDYFSDADHSLFNYICENKIFGIKEIYIKNWW